MLTFVASIFVFGLLIMAHEVGHFIAARWCGIKVLELAIGFGPRLVGWERKGTRYSLRLIPLGGFCRMLGEDPEEAGDPDAFPRKSIAQRALVLLSGSLMNLVLALLVFFVVFFFLTGVPSDSSRIGSVIPGSAAEEAGLQAGDEIVRIDGEPTGSWSDVVAHIAPRPDQEVELVIRRQGKIITLRAVPALNPQTGKAALGIYPQVDKYRFIPSLTLSLDRFATVIGSIFMVFTGKLPLDVTGPVGIVMIVGEVARTGFVDLLWLTAFIGISLGIINLLPIPALDGGRLLFLLIEALRGRPLDPEKEGFIHFLGFALLILIMLLVTYNDLLRWDLLPGR
ncbi:MAG TPA: RIP metalloprotease RseP [Bacillota bacterium]|jgi:regulator of sigma E protease|nr:RIP metalloprotease RseP [Bacillota bacterium]HOB87332.1 RIP metalloprotease RseP [Bacillota bacterium]HOP68443.1 RIP metalloprotease RseP [Bacillota bacterium]HPT33549.1 RIP metalloprotease RseP [Bacillota bacterium]HPZ64436.1 RIP metalloprotease RseP [Bacillota bacterium]